MLKEITIGFGVLGGVLDLINPQRINGSSQYVKLLQVLLNCPNVKNIVIHSRFSHQTEKVKAWEKLPNANKLIYPSEMALRIGEYLWKDHEFFSDRQPYGSEPVQFWRSREYHDLYVKYCLEKVPPCDFGVFFMANGCIDTNIPHCLHKANGSEYYKCQMESVHKQTGPFLHYLNLSGMPWFWICTDDRIITRKWREDCINLPLEIIGQWNQNYLWKTMPSYQQDRERVDRHLVETYGKVQMLNLIGEHTAISPCTPRSRALTIVANQSTYSNDLSCKRFKLLDSWILQNVDKYPEFTIIGDWDYAFKCGYRSTDAKEIQAFNRRPYDLSEVKYPQFIGKMKADATDEILKDSRYSLCIPVIPGYLTSKFYELISVGVVPFIIPEYDEQFNGIPKDSYIRVSTPEELIQKIDYLEQHPQYRCEIVQNLQKLYLEDYTVSGRFIIDQINHRLAKFHLPNLEFSK